MHPSDLQKRRAGILLHPTSLPSGVLDEDVERWLQLIADAGFSMWQVLPLGEPQMGLSPYQCTSAFAFNPGLLSDVLSAIPVDEDDADYLAFCENQKFWLDDYALFKILKEHFDDAQWIEWPEKWKFREEAALEQSCAQYRDMIAELKWQQYLLHKRWREIRQIAADMDILLFGDMPIFVAHDSADVWAHPEWFRLDTDGNMEVVTGVPPDYFSEFGQRWGNPHYDWDAMREDDFSWWKSRVHHHLEIFDLVRIDHFRGLEAAWEIDAACETAVDGQWVKMPGDELLQTIQTSLVECYEQLPFVAEDLGVITKEVTALRKKYHLPGMSILQFGFDAFDDNPHKPKNIHEDAVVYTGTHDNDTTRGWYESLDEGTKQHVLNILNVSLNNTVEDDKIEVDGSSCWYDNVDIADLVVDKLIDSAMHSKANICIIPLQDCLHLGSEARMNTPGTIEGNWQWKFQWHDIESLHNGSHVKQMRQRAEASQRLITSRVNDT